MTTLASGVWQDVRFAVRILWRARAQALVAICTIGVAIGANTTIYTVVNGTLLASLPYPEPERLMQVAHAYGDGSIGSSISVPKYLFWSAHATSFDTLAAYQDLGGSGVNLTGRGELPERVGATRASSSFFDVFGVQPALGRGFHPRENRPGAGRVVVLSHQLWMRRFGGTAAILGRTIAINEDRYEVVGVMPRTFAFPTFAELWLPLQIDPASDVQHGFLDVIGRLKPQVTLESARAQMTVLRAEYARINPADVLADASFHVRPLREALFGFLRPALLTLLAAVGAVLLIACVNVANLQLARATTRSAEIGVRVALGATRSRIVRQLLVESAVLALTGGIVGLWLAAFLLPAVLSLAPGSLESLSNVAIDVRVLLFTMTLSLLAALVFGIVPARAASRHAARAVRQGRGATLTGANIRTRSVMIASEVAIAIMLAVGAGLMVRTFVTLVTSRAGFEPRGLLTMQVHFSGMRYENAAALDTVASELVNEVRGIAGVSAAALATSLPFGTGTGMSFTIDGRASDLREGAGRMRYVGATPEFFDALGIRIVRGRSVAEHDHRRAQLVAVINETAARRFWPGADPIGQRITIGQPVNPEVADAAPREIVGVVADVKENGMDLDAPPMVYVPLAQVPPPLATLFTRLLPLSVVLRTDRDPATLAAAAQSSIRRVDSLLPVTSIVSGEQRLRGSLQTQQFNALLMGGLAVLAVVLAFTGIYGVISCLVAQRTNELGVRLALGATPRDVLRLVVAQGLRPVIYGAVIGVGLTVMSSRALGTLLFGACHRPIPWRLPAVRSPC